MHGRGRRDVAGALQPAGDPFIVARMEFLPSDVSQWPWVPLAAAFAMGLFFGVLFGGKRRKVARIERVADPTAGLRTELDAAHRTRADLQRQLEEARAGRAQAEAELQAVRADARRGAATVVPLTTVSARDDVLPDGERRDGFVGASRVAVSPIGVEAPAGGAAGDLPLTRLKGVGPKLGSMLEAQGVMSVGQLAALTDGQVAELDGRLGDFNGRLQRDRVAEQARLLAEGRQAEYSARFGAL